MTTSTKRFIGLTGAAILITAFSVTSFADVMLGTGGYNREMRKMGMMKMLDADGNHMVTSAEFDEYYGKLFDELDTDKDGTVDTTEWVGVKGKAKLDFATGGYSNQLRTMKMRDLMDADSDHKVSKDEFINHHNAIFTAKDKSNDGELNPQEWLAKHIGK